MIAGQGGKLVRTAGGTARLMAKEGDWATVILPSGEMRMVRKECRATIGKLSNPDYQNVSVGKAGRTRHRGRSGPRSRQGQNPVAHPMGGGEGRSKRRTSSVLADGRAGKGRQDKKSEKGQQQADYSSPQNSRNKDSLI